MTIACPRHGVIAAAADTPCPDCRVALYDLGDRNARDVVRANRFTALKNRRVAFAAVAMAVGGVCAFMGGGRGTGIMFMNVAPLVVGVVLAKFAAEPFARAIETDPRLRDLDRWFQNQRV